MKAMKGGPESICPAILWAVFRAHDKMTGFEDANFENHPSIASKFVKFLATNTGNEGMAVLEENVVSLKAEVKELEKQSTAACTKADTKHPPSPTLPRKHLRSCPSKLTTLHSRNR